MVSIKAVKASNAAIKTTPGLANLTAVFTGATSGIGLATIKELAKNAEKPAIYIVGRTESTGQRIIDDLKTLNADGTYVFIKGEVSLIKSVDEVCAEIKRRITHLNILCMSQGYLSFGGRVDTAEGLAEVNALRYYSRARFIVNLLPLLRASTQSSPRVLSILASGSEPPLIEPDLELKTHYSFVNSVTQSGTLNTVALQHLSQANPGISFMHAYPGLIKTDIYSKFSAPVAFLMRWVLLPLLTPMTYSVEESGARQCFHLTSARFPAAEAPVSGETGVPLPEGLSVVERSGGIYRVSDAGGVYPEVKYLQEAAADGVHKRVWDHTTETFDEITGS